jgi:SAM-dependent methyltransferase
MAERVENLRLVRGLQDHSEISRSHASASMRATFEKIYAANSWGHGSGSGSLPIHTRGYINLLQEFLREHDVKSVLDHGCGDWQFSQFVDWGGIQYLGMDLVQSVIDTNIARYCAPNINFAVKADGAALPPAELLIMKDVLQHWSNESVRRFLPVLKRYRFCLITNCVNPRGETVNTDIADGEFRYLDIRLPPFNYDAAEIYSFTNKRSLWRRLLTRPRWRKPVLLIQSP